MKAGKFGWADICCLTMVLVWGANMSLAKDALREFSPMSFNAVRLSLAAALLWMFTFAVEGRVQLPRLEARKLVLLGLVGNMCYQIFFIYGLDRTKAGNVGLLLSGGTILTALLSRFLGHERLGRMVWAGIFLSLGGVVLILLESAEFAFGGGTLSGDLLVLASAVCWSVYTVYAKPLMKMHSPLSLTTFTLSAGALGFLLVSVPYLAREEWAAVSTRSYLELGYSLVFAIAIGYVLWFYAIDRLGSTRTAVYGNLIPFSGIFFAWAFLHERITLFQILGAVFILMGIYLTRKGRPPDAPAALRQRQY